VFHISNGGQSRARNFGIDRARGEYISFADADDFVSPHYIEDLLQPLQQGAADISVGAFSTINNGKVHDNSNGEQVLMSSETAIRRMLLDDGFDMGIWGKMYKAKLFDVIRFPEGKYFEDSLTTYQIFSKANKVAFNSKSMYFYVKRDDSTVNGEFNPRKLDLIEMTLQAEIYISDLFPSLKQEAHRRVIWGYFSTLNQVLKADNDNLVREYGDDIAKYLLSQYRFVLRTRFIPARDKFGMIALKLFGIKGYYFLWKVYARVVKNV
jgi:glycosyltransferase involved in cell wall biosynthesis